MFDQITSLQNPRIKAARRLRDHRERDVQNRFTIDGYREIKQALRAGVEIVEAYVSSESLAGRGEESLQHDLAAAGIRVFVVPPRVFDAICYGKRSDGMVAVAKPPVRTLEEFPATGEVLLGVIERVEKPGNIGAVVRSADGAGLDGILVADAATDVYNPNVIRASLGTIFTMAVCRATSSQIKAWLEQTGTRILVARLHDSVEYTTADYRGRVAIVLGSEAEGVSPVWRDDRCQGIRLPMKGLADSLNVSAAAAVLFYEAQRQRRSHRM